LINVEEIPNERGKNKLLICLWAKEAHID
jgi:hypothetical protein